MRNRWSTPCTLLALLVSLLTNSVTAAPPTTETLRIAVHLGAMRDVSRADVEVSLKVWANEVTKALEVPAEIFFYPTLPEIRRDLETGQVNFVIADGVSILRHFATDDLADGFGNIGKEAGTMVLLANKKAAIASTRDLAGKRIVLLSDNEISSLWLETTCLRTFRQTCAQAALIVSKEKRSQQQVLKVFFDKADAALVRSEAYEVAAELNPQIRDHLQIVERITIYPAALGLFSSRVSPEFREYVIDKVPQIQHHPRGKQLLEVLQTERIGRVAKGLLEPIRSLLHEHEALSGRYRRRGVAR